MCDDCQWDQKRRALVCNGYVRVNDEGSRFVADAHNKALARATGYMGRGYWKAAERWADIAWSLAAALNEVDWQPIDREDA